MQLRHLKYFVALGQEAHFGRAADTCNVTQSTLSAAIRQLEIEIGAPLIERDKRFKGFTAEGRVLLDWAKRVVSERDALDQQIGMLRGELTGELSIGVIPTALPTIGLFTTPLSRVHPKVTLKILSQTSNEIQRALDDFRLDIGVTYLDNEPMHGVDVHPLYTENYILLTPADGPFRGRDDVTWREAADTPLCLLTPDMQNRRIINTIFQSVDRVPNAHIETNSVMTLCSHIKTGVWSSVLPNNFLWVFGVPPGMIALPLVDPVVTHVIGVVVRRQQPHSPLVEAFLAAVHEGGGAEQIRRWDKTQA
ncbi:MAG: LysR family transcriptional regulator [Rhodospirillales bacterium]|jgi:DNA-binding transcriptional LysR family regulator|nr:LysR family transcriptional regulator [Rhodospirillales bacterium]